MAIEWVSWFTWLSANVDSWLGIKFMSNMSSQSTLLNVFNITSGQYSCSKPEEFSPKVTELFLDREEQPWFKQIHVGKF